MTDLGAEGTNPLHSPKRKFSLRKPHMSGGSSGDHDPQSLRSSNGYSNTNTLTNKERRNFTEELQNLPDLQVCEIVLHAFHILLESHVFININ